MWSRLVWAAFFKLCLVCFVVFKETPLPVDFQPPAVRLGPNGFTIQVDPTQLCTLEITLNWAI